MEMRSRMGRDRGVSQFSLRNVALIFPIQSIQYLNKKIKKPWEGVGQDFFYGPRGLSGGISDPPPLDGRHFDHPGPKKKHFLPEPRRKKKKKKKTGGGSLFWPILVNHVPGHPSILPWSRIFLLKKKQPGGGTHVCIYPLPYLKVIPIYDNDFFLKKRVMNGILAMT